MDSISHKAGAGPDLKKAKRTKQNVKHPLDKQPPHSIEAEQGVLGCILLSPSDCLPACIEKFKASQHVFYDLRHQAIYTELLAMFSSGIAIDIITLQQRLKDKGLLQQIGGIPYLNSVQDSVPSAANLSYYLGFVLEKFLLRMMVHACQDSVGQVYDYEGDNVPQLLDEVQARVLKLSDILETSEVQTPNTLVDESINVIEKCFQQQGVVSGTPTGFVDLDKKTDGLHAGEMFVIAGRPSTGKTTIAMNIAEYVVLEKKLPVAVFSLEMTAEALMTRMLCSHAHVNLRKIKDGFMSEADFPKLTSSAGKLKKAPLYIDDTGGLSILQLRARARRMWQQFGIKLFIIDYLQLMHDTSRRSQENRVQEVTEISKGVKAMAKELNVPVIVLSQLNRQSENRPQGAAPKLSDLRESGAIEQDADVVGLLYKPSPEEADAPAEAVGYPVNMLIAKQRNGPTGDVHFTFLNAFTRFQTMAKVSAEDVPGAAVQGELNAGEQPWQPYADN